MNWNKLDICQTKGIINSHSIKLKPFPVIETIPVPNKDAVVLGPVDGDWDPEATSADTEVEPIDSVI